MSTTRDYEVRYNHECGRRDGFAGGEMEIDKGSGGDLLSKQNNVFFGTGSLMKITDNRSVVPNIHVPKRVIADKTKRFTNEFASRLEKLFFRRHETLPD